MAVRNSPGKDVLLSLTMIFRPNTVGERSHVNGFSSLGPARRSLKFVVVRAMIDLPYQRTTTSGKTSTIVVSKQRRLALERFGKPRSTKLHPGLIVRTGRLIFGVMIVLR